MAGAGQGKSSPVSSALVRLHDVAQDPVAANLLRHTTDNLLADFFAFSFGNPGGREVLHNDRLHRHALVKPQARIVDRGVAAPGPAAGKSKGFVPDLAVRNLLEPELGEQGPLRHRIDPEPAFRPGAKDLAPEPCHLLREGGHLLLHQPVRLLKQRVALLHQGERLLKETGLLLQLGTAFLKAIGKLMQEGVLPLQLGDPEGLCCHGD